MRVVSHGIDLSHSECAQSMTPAKAVRDRSKCLRTNQCVLNRFLLQDIPEQELQCAGRFLIHVSCKYIHNYLHLSNF